MSTATATDYASMTAREILDIIDAKLTVGDCEAEQLAHVLSALRGPDNRDDTNAPQIDTVKADTTAVVRSIAFPQLAAVRHGAHTWDMDISGRQTITTYTMMSARREVSFHFTEHIRAACVALGILITV